MIKTYKDLNNIKKKSDELDGKCEECNIKDVSVSQNLILVGFKICKYCRTSKTIYPI